MTTPSAGTTAAPAVTTAAEDFFRAARPRRSIITVCVILATILQTLDATIANVALPRMQGALSATSDQIAWVLTSYLIASAIMTPSIGWLVGRFGRRRMFLWSMSGFTLASMLCGAAQTLDQMVIFRLTQGICGASLIPLGQSVILDMYEPHERAGAMAVWSVGIMLGPVIGPTLGALLTESYSWRYVFYVNLPLGILGLLGIWAFLPRSQTHRQAFDWTGFSALAIGIAGLQLVLDRGETKNWFSSTEILVEAAMSLAGFYVFAVHMWFAPKPLLNRVLFKDRNFVACLGMQFACGMVLNATSALLPPYFQGLGGYPVMLSGLAMAPRGLGTIIASPIVGRLVGRMDPRKMMALGLFTLAYSTWIMTRWTPDVTLTQQIPMAMLQGATISLVFVPLQMIAFSTLPPDLRTEGSGVIALQRNMGGSIGVAVMETELARHTQTAHQDLASFATPFNRALSQGGAQTWFNLRTLPGRAMLDGVITHQAQIIAYTDDFLLMTLLILPTGLLVFLMRRPAPLGR